MNEFEVEILKTTIKKIDKLSTITLINTLSLFLMTLSNCKEILRILTGN